ncbi:MAG: glutamyl-tRNA synthetase [Rickettsiales bacterium]|jgi:glutamyl-tRNA synthetase
MTEIRTRFAPSPTGDLHIGGARTALFNYLFSKNNNGKFLLRIEDTDKKRSNQEAIDIILNGLKWLELNFDEEIIFQSQNIKNHQRAVEKLLDLNKAYYCYTTKEELEEKRQKAQKEGRYFRFQSPYRDKIWSEYEEKPLNKPVVRIRSEKNGFSIIKDLIQGEVKIANEEVSDFIILREDGTPTYNLSVVIDDFDMKISHIIRGDDHLTNSFAQKLIYDSLDLTLPEFAHIPLIHGSDGAKMSKRHGATNILSYEDMGYLPEAMRNYLLKLGWSYQDIDIINDTDAQKLFNLKNIGKSPSRFDFAKLDNINKYYLKNKTEAQLFDLIKNELGDVNKDSQEKIIKALKFIKEKAVKMPDLTEPAKIYIDNYRKEISENDLEKVKNKKDLTPLIKNVLEKIDDWNLEEIKSRLNNFCQENNLKIKDFGPAIRIILTFSSKSAGGIFDVINILEKDEVLKRIKFLT